MKNRNEPGTTFATPNGCQFDNTRNPIDPEAWQLHDRIDCMAATIELAVLRASREMDYDTV